MTQTHLRTFNGTVVSKKTDQTIIVAVVRTKIHPKYGKRIVQTKRYAVHDPKNQYQDGQAVTFVECRPISKTKRWRVVYEGNKQ